MERIRTVGIASENFRTIFTLDFAYLYKYSLHLIHQPITLCIANSKPENILLPNVWPRPLLVYPAKSIQFVALCNGCTLRMVARKCLGDKLFVCIAESNSLLMHPTSAKWPIVKCVNSL